MAISDIVKSKISGIKKEFRRKKKTMDVVKPIVLETSSEVVNHMGAYFESVFEKHHPGCMYDDYDMDSYGEYD